MELTNKARDAYPAQLARLLGRGWEVRNFGVSGATLMNAGNKPYAREPALKAALDWKPDVVLIVLGTNDTKDMNIGRHPDDCASSYKALIRSFRAANSKAKIFLYLPPPVFPEAFGIRESVLGKNILPRIREVAWQADLPIIAFHTPLKTDGAHYPDKVHPDAEGTGELARIVYGSLSRVTQTGTQP